MLPLNLLRVFHVLAEKRSVLKAAEALYISQPAVSNALKKLQKNVGVRFFHKEGRTLVLTEHGQRLHEMTGRLFAVEGEIEVFLRQIDNQAKHNIRVGLVTIYERFGIEDILQSFSRIDKNISVSVHSGNSRSIVEMLKDNAIDMAISGDVVVDPDLHYKLYKRHELFLVAPVGHRLYGKETFSAEDIRNERMVLKESGSSVRQTVDVFFGNLGIKPQVVTELSNLDSIFNLIKRERCITFLPDLSVWSKLESDSAFSFSRYAECRLSFNTYLVYPRNAQYALATRRIIEQFHDLVDDETTGPECVPI